MDSDVIGDLALLDDGTWSYVSDLPLPAKAGELLLLSDSETKERHVFAVASITPWGAVLGRLDRRPISPRLRGAFGPAASAVCLGTSAQRACVEAAAKGTWFSVFETQNDLIVTADGIPKRIGRIRAGDPASDLWIKDVTNWVAVVDGLGLPASALRVGVSPRCEASSTDFFAVQAEANGRHPLDVENRAYQDLVDAYVACSDNGLIVAIPSAARARLPAADIRLQTHPVLVVDDGRMEGSLNDVGRFSAMVGVGDFDGAGLLLLKLAPKNPRLALQGAEILAAAGRPDEALALAFRATKSAWNREGDFHWVYLRARVALGLGDEAGFVERWSRLPEMARRLENNDVHGWIVWQAFLSEFKGNAAFDTYDESLKGRELSKWRRLLRLSSALRTHDTAEIEAFSSGNDDDALSAGFRGESVAIAGDGPLDVYGRLWASGVRGDLSRVGQGEFRPGYLNTSEQNSAFELLNLNRLVGRRAKVEEFREALRCDAPSLGPTEGLDLDPVAVWALTTGRAAACSNPPALLKVATQLPKEERAATREFVEALFEQVNTTQQSADALMDSAIWAHSATLGESCRRWNLTVGFSALKADRLEDAQAAAIRANACSTRDYSTSEKNLAAGINWLRTGTISRDFEGPVRDAVARITRQKTTGCPLLTSWDINLEELAEPEIQARLVAMDPLAQEDFAVITSLQHLLEARLSLPVLAAAIQAGDAVKAAKTLQAIQSHFRAARHLPGERFVRLVEQTVFEGKVSEYADGVASKTQGKSVAAKLRSGKLVDTKGWTPSQLHVAAFMRTGEVKAVLSAPDSDFSAELCALPLPRSNDGPINLDADF